MRVIYNLGTKLKSFDRPYVALGIFDGMHRGHQHVLRTMLRAASRQKKKTICVTFFPHPSKILSSKNIFVHLVSLKHRIKLISDLGLDACIVINFNRKFSFISPHDFIIKLQKNVDPAAIFVGSNFTFGRGGVGNVKLLKKLAEKYNFKVREIIPIRSGNKIISSTLTRSLIKSGQLNLVRRYLGRNVSVCGKVVNGKRIGRKLGYHTANIDTEHEVIPPVGIYAARVIVEKKKFPAVAYIGISPTMHFRYRLPHLEVYILNFHRNIYGETIEVELIKKIRDEHEFNSLPELVSQIKQDVIKTRSILSSG